MKGAMDKMIRQLTEGKKIPLAMSKANQRLISRIENEFLQNQQGKDSYLNRKTARSELCLFSLWAQWGSERLQQEGSCFPLLLNLADGSATSVALK